VVTLLEQLIGKGRDVRVFDPRARPARHHQRRAAHGPERSHRAVHTTHQHAFRFAENLLRSGMDFVRAHGRV
jgi:hypothetical protein